MAKDRTLEASRGDVIRDIEEVEGLLSFCTAAVFDAVSVDDGGIGVEELKGLGAVLHTIKQKVKGVQDFLEVAA